jgi:glycosyltransferase involved in cell wall biosynthesis
MMELILLVGLGGGIGEKMDQQGRLSIGLPVFNGEQLIEQALDSLLAQTFQDFQLIISDNASTDRTPEICKDYQARDSRVHYTCMDKNYGAARNFNRVFELASGQYFKWAAHDDIIEPTFLQQCIDVLDQNPSCAIRRRLKSMTRARSLACRKLNGLSVNHGHRFASVVFCASIIAVLSFLELYGRARCAPRRY